jgi:ATP-dependent Clp protease ATP-binding subunit ClpC
MTKFASEVGYEPIVERERESARLIRILTRKNKNNPCLIGEAGVGKTAIVEGLAMKIASGEVPEELKDKIIISVDLTSMVAGAKYRGDFEERIKSIVKEARKFPSVILFIDEIHTIVGAGAAEGAIDAANILKPELARGDIKLIGATTISEYRKYIEKDAALERRFQSVLVEEPTRSQTVKILKSIKKRYEEYHGTVIDDEAIECAVSLSERYITDRFLPDKAIDVIDEACALVKSDKVIKNRNNANKGSDCSDNYQLIDKATSFNIGSEISPICPPRVTRRVVEELISEITGIDINKKGKLDINRISEGLKRRVIGQDKAIDALSRSLIKSMVGLNDPTRPRGVFLFLGESGVGKTELAKALSDELFCGEDALIRYDMTELSEKGSVSKIIGAAPGYVGYDETNSLLEKIRMRPYSVVLLDEIEKAHPDVLSLFLTIFDEGKITDATGRTINFKNTYIIMTSNVGNDSRKIKSTPGFIGADGSSLQSGLKEYFSEEFINRIDEIIVFNRLKLEDLAKISDCALQRVLKNMKDIGLNCEISDSVAMHLASENLRCGLGARQLLRTVSDKIEGEIAAIILSTPPTEDESLIVDVIDGKISFKIKKQVSVAK